MWLKKFLIERGAPKSEVQRLYGVPSLRHYGLQKGQIDYQQQPQHYNE